MTVGREGEPIEAGGGEAIRSARATPNYRVQATAGSVRSCLASAARRA